MKIADISFCDYFTFSELEQFRFEDDGTVERLVEEWKELFGREVAVLNRMVMIQHAPGLWGFLDRQLGRIQSAHISLRRRFFHQRAAQEIVALAQRAAAVAYRKEQRWFVILSKREQDEKFRRPRQRLLRVRAVLGEGESLTGTIISLGQQIF